MSPDTKLRHIQKLRTSGGWVLLEGIMRDEIVELALATARKPNKTDQEAAFMAGCLQAAENLLRILDRLEDRFKTEILMAQAAALAAGNAQANPAQPASQSNLNPATAGEP